MSCKCVSVLVVLLLQLKSFHSFIMASFCFSDGWEASKSDAPKVDKTLPHLFSNGITIRLGVDFQKLLPIVGVFRPTHRHLQVSSVRVAAEVQKNTSVCQSVSHHCEQSVSWPAWCVTQFLQSLSSRQSYSQKDLSFCPRTSLKRWMVGRKRTALHQNGQHPTSRDRVYLVLPLNWAQTSSTSRYEQTWKHKQPQQPTTRNFVCRYWQIPLCISVTLDWSYHDFGRWPRMAHKYNFNILTKVTAIWFSGIKLMSIV